MATQPTTHVHLTQARDELLRMRAFLGLSGLLAFLGAGASFLVDGDPVLRLAFVVSVVLMLAVYGLFAHHTRDAKNYDELKAGLVISACNLAGVLACFFYGLWSPAPMVLMMPIGFFGLMRSGKAAWTAAGLLTGVQAVAQLAILLGVVKDRGAISVEGLPTLLAWLYAGLVHLVYWVYFLFARASYRATTQALNEAERAGRLWARDEAVREEVEQQLDQARGGHAYGALSGQTVQGWTLHEVLGRGATGAVYACEREGQLAAAKMLAMRSEQGQHLMMREAEVVRRLRSPHIVALLDVIDGEHQGFVMERLEGQDLGGLLRERRQLEPAEVLRLVQHVAAGLEVARQAKVVHRDVKPSNLFAAQGPSGETWKLLDFGISKLQDYDATLTQGLLMGTPGYMAPEQARMDRLDHRADVFSLAAVAYRALTGAPAFRSKGQAWALGILYEQPRRPGEWVQGLHRDVDAVLALGLAKAPEARLGSALELAQALEHALQGRLAPQLRTRAAVLLAEHPWGARRVPQGDLS